LYDLNKQQFKNITPVNFLINRNLSELNERLLLIINK